MATTLVSLGALAGTITGATPTPVALDATFAAASMTALTAGTGVQFNWVNNGSLVAVVYNTAAAGGTTWEPTIQAQILGVAIPITSQVITVPSIIGAFIVGPFGPSKFNDSNGFCWLTQVGASAATSYIGVFSLPGSLT